jgi:hypothetical protein
MLRERERERIAMHGQGLAPVSHLRNKKKKKKYPHSEDACLRSIRSAHQGDRLPAHRDKQGVAQTQGLTHTPVVSCQ